jgi:hypothetical protein
MFIVCGYTRLPVKQFQGNETSCLRGFTYVIAPAISSLCPRNVFIQLLRASLYLNRIGLVQERIKGQISKTWLSSIFMSKQICYIIWRRGGLLVASKSSKISFWTFHYTRINFKQKIGEPWFQD